MNVQTHSLIKPIEVLCPYCKEIADDVEAVKCAVCRTWHHKACWNENTRCTVYGCLGTVHKNIQGKPDWGVDLFFAMILMALGFVASGAWIKIGSFHNVEVAIATGTFLYFWAFLFLASYFWRDASWLLRAMMWICENYSTPRGAWTAFLWSALNFLGGTICIIQGFK